MQDNIKTRIAIKVSIISIAVNIVLSGIKLLAGLLGNSQALISDAIHSASDVFTTLIVIIGVKISSKEADDEHPYGHERMESLAELILAASLILVGIGVGISGLKTLINPLNNEIPSQYTLIIAAISIIFKEALFWYTIKAAKNINSSSLKADAWHHRSDALSSIGSFIGIELTRVGFIHGDAIASIIICIFILKVGIEILLSGVNKLVDHSCDIDTVNNIRNIAEYIDGVKHIDNVKTRMFGDKIYVDMEISVDGNLRLIEAHEIAEHVHDSIENKIGRCKHCMVHVNPAI